jgi:phosphatidylserine/phosphatidylglycerophosphate/cardiolipin synthase-like enzyme
LKDFSEYIQSNASFYIWPYRNRVINGDEQTGSLHAKFILQDNSKLFVSSANLTQSAMDRNIELGVIIEAPEVIEKLQSQLDSLIIENEITKLN